MTYQPKEYVKIEDVLCTHESEKALLCVVSNDECWIPRSQLGEENEIEGEGSEGTLVVSKWFAAKIGAI